MIDHEDDHEAALEMEIKANVIAKKSKIPVRNCKAATERMHGRGRSPKNRRLKLSVTASSKTIIVLPTYHK